jgi:hypothetical protein
MLAIFYGTMLLHASILTAFVRLEYNPSPKYGLDIPMDPSIIS